MKSATLLGCVLMVVGSAQLMAVSPLETTISLCDLNDQLIQEFSYGTRRDLIVECPEGASLAFKLTLKGEFLALESAAIAPLSAVVTPLYLRILKTCYIRCEGRENFLFSTDLKNWKGFSEFFTGELKVSVETDNAGPVAALQLELSERKK